LEYPGTTRVPDPAGEHIDGEAAFVLSALAGSSIIHPEHDSRWNSRPLLGSEERVDDVERGSESLKATLDGTLYDQAAE
jgi:hypothetical protein